MPKVRQVCTTKSMLEKLACQSLTLAHPQRSLFGRNPMLSLGMSDCTTLAVATPIAPTNAYKIGTDDQTISKLR
jgi:hypothetical protein